MLQVEPLAYELDSWLNFTKWHAVLSRSRFDMLQTYEFGNVESCYECQGKVAECHGAHYE